jgi:hypothetical protein
MALFGRYSPFAVYDMTNSFLESFGDDWMGLRGASNFVRTNFVRMTSTGNQQRFWQGCQKAYFETENPN